VRACMRACVHVCNTVPLYVCHCVCDTVVCFVSENVYMCVWVYMSLCKHTHLCMRVHTSTYTLVYVYTTGGALYTA